MALYWINKVVKSFKSSSFAPNSFYERSSKKNDLTCMKFSLKIFLQTDNVSAVMILKAPSKQIISSKYFSISSRTSTLQSLKTLLKKMFELSLKISSFGFSLYFLYFGATVRLYLASIRRDLNQIVDWSLTIIKCLPGRTYPAKT